MKNFITELENNLTLEISGIKINKVTNNALLEIIRKAIFNNSKITISYINANVVNIANSNVDFKKNISAINIKHPDGIGIFLASRILYGKNGFEERVTGTDFYLILINEIRLNNWSVFLFGDVQNSKDYQKLKYNGINVVGIHDGYEYDTNLTNVINSLNPQIIFVGLGTIKQENWILANYDLLNANIILAVGNGLRIFWGKKIRGPVIFRKYGLEWVIRLIGNPHYFWKRYLIGNPCFMFRIIKEKIRWR